jgi:hypothetical protein
VAEGGGPQLAHKFFRERRADLPDPDDNDEGPGGLLRYPNVPARIGAVISSDKRLATLHELSTVYSLEDLYDMLEVILIDSHNERLVRKWLDKQGRK